MIEIEMTSLEIAELTLRNHRDVMRSIRNKLIPLIGVDDDCVKMRSPIYSIKTGSYLNAQNKSQPMFILNKYAANALVANFKLEHALVIVEHIDNLEQELLQKEKELDMMKNIVWKVINNKSYLGREYALKSAGIKHPRLFMRYLRESKGFYNSVYERDFLKNQYVSKNTQVEMFTQKGFQWLLESVDKINNWVEDQKKLPA